MATVAVVGGGNIGTLMAAEISRNGCSVRMCASDAERWSWRVEVYGPSDEPLFSDGLEFVTSSLAQAVRGADWVFVTHPSSRFAALACELAPFAEPGQRICVAPGADAELFFAGAIERGATFLGLQRVHSIARLMERGRSVYQLGRKPSVQLASIPSSEAHTASGNLPAMLGMPVEELPNYLVETLTPSNPILHTARLATMFRDWREGVTYPRNNPFYETWDDASSELMIACDGELQALCRAIEGTSALDLSGVRPLTEHYESPDARSMTEKISHIPAFRGVRVAHEGGRLRRVGARLLLALLHGRLRGRPRGDPRHRRHVRGRHGEHRRRPRVVREGVGEGHVATRNIAGRRRNPKELQVTTQMNDMKGIR